VITAIRPPQHQVSERQQGSLSIPTSQFEDYANGPQNVTAFRGETVVIAGGSNIYLLKYYSTGAHLLLGSLGYAHRTPFEKNSHMAKNAEKLPQWKITYVAIKCQI